MHHHIRFQESDRARLMEIIQRLHQAESEGNELERTAWVYHLLGMLNGAPEPELVSVSAPLPEKFQEVLTYINRSFPDIHTVSDIADHFFISTATLTRWFREYLQITPKNYLAARRLTYSKDLLDRGLSVTEVSSTAGFSSCSHFICAFRQIFGTTPLQYQKSLHIANPV
jgi:AraC-like DNA-binding protein